MRGVYPSEDFKMVSKYGLKLLVSKDNGLNEYLDNVMNQLRGESCETASAPLCPGLMLTPLPPLPPLPPFQRLDPQQGRAKAGDCHLQCGHQGSAGAVAV